MSDSSVNSSKTITVTLKNERVLEEARAKVARCWNRETDGVDDDAVIDTALEVLAAEARLVDILPPSAVN